MKTNESSTSAPVPESHSAAVAVAGCSLCLPDPLSLFLFSLPRAELTPSALLSLFFSKASFFDTSAFLDDYSGVCIVGPAISVLLFSPSRWSLHPLSPSVPPLLPLHGE